MPYNFNVPSMQIRGTRSPWTDTDYATLAITTVDSVGTTVGTYGPISQSLGGVHSGYHGLSMELTDIDVPDGGTMNVVFTVMNKGTWSARGSILDALDKVAAGIVGALAGGQLAGVTNPPTKNPDGTMTPPSQAAMSPWWAGLIALGVLAIIEGVDLVWVDCDGWVVNGSMVFGRADLDEMASKAPWSWTANYPGSDSPDLCGSTSYYSVDYTTYATSLPGIVVPDVIGQSPAAAINVLKGVNLVGKVTSEEKGIVDEPQVFAQDPTTGFHLLPIPQVDLSVMIPRGGPLP
jgi:hypothetical protein